MIGMLYKTILIVATLGLTTAGVLADDAGRQITVSGQGVAEAEPDMALIRLGVVHEADDASTAMATTQSALQAVLARVAEMGVDERDIQTSQFRLEPIWSRSRSDGRERPRIVGFRSASQLMIRVRDIDALTGIVDAVVADGANGLDGLQFTVQDPEPLMQEARRKAVADAIAKAEVIAEAAGVTLGPVVSVVEHGGAAQPVMMERAAAFTDSASIATGEVTMRAQVQMVFEIAED